MTRVLGKDFDKVVKIVVPPKEMPYVGNTCVSIFIFIFKRFLRREVNGIYGRWVNGEKMLPV